jgi:hypothetical protein
MASSASAFIVLCLFVQCINGNGAGAIKKVAEEQGLQGDVDPNEWRLLDPEQSKKHTENVSLLIISQLVCVN